MGHVQGEYLSPFLYAVYAEVVVIFSENLHALTNRISVVNVCSNQYDMDVNLLKTNIVISHKK